MKSLFNPKGRVERRNSLPFLLLWILRVRETLYQLHRSPRYSTVCSEDSGKMLAQQRQKAHKRRHESKGQILRWPQLERPCSSEQQETEKRAQWISTDLQRFMENLAGRDLKTLFSKYYWPKGGSDFFNQKSLAIKHNGSGTFFSSFLKFARSERDVMGTLHSLYLLFKIHTAHCHHTPGQTRLWFTCSSVPLSWKTLS